MHTQPTSTASSGEELALSIYCQRSSLIRCQQAHWSINVSRDVPIRKLTLVIFSAGRLLPSRPLPSFFCGLMTSTNLCPSLQNIGILAENLDAPDIETPQERVFAYVEDALGCVI
jgi:hypothetical protein